jgi:arylsulfatase
MFPLDLTTKVPRMEAMNARLFPWLEAHGREPFFLYMHALDTHFPHYFIPPFDQWFDPNYRRDQLVELDLGQSFARRDGQPLTQDDQAYIRAAYDGGILDADTQIGKLLQKLDELGLRSNTVIVISSDHGQALGEDGHTTEHEGSSDQVLHAVFILSGPGLPILRPRP